MSTGKLESIERVRDIIKGSVIGGHTSASLYEGLDAVEKEVGALLAARVDEARPDATEKLRVICDFVSEQAEDMEPMSALMLMSALEKTFRAYVDSQIALINGPRDTEGLL